MNVLYFIINYVDKAILVVKQHDTNSIYLAHVSKDRN